MPRELPFACPVCQWQGMQEPSEPLQDTTCPRCGTLLTPLSFGQTWGVVLLILAVVFAFVFGAIWLFTLSR